MPSSAVPTRPPRQVPTCLLRCAVPSTGTKRVHLAGSGRRGSAHTQLCPNGPSPHPKPAYPAVSVRSILLQRAGNPLPCSRSRLSLCLRSSLVSSSRLPHFCEFVVRSLYQRGWKLPRDTSARFVLHSFPSPHPQAAKHGGRGFPSPARTAVRAAPVPPHRTHSAGRWERGRRPDKDRVCLYTKLYTALV